MVSDGAHRVEEVGWCKPLAYVGSAPRRRTRGEMVTNKERAAVCCEEEGVERGEDGRDRVEGEEDSGKLGFGVRSIPKSSSPMLARERMGAMAREGCFHKFVRAPQRFFC